MQHKFIQTTNYINCLEAMKELARLPRDMEKMGLFYGNAGRGKSFRRWRAELLFSNDEIWADRLITLGRIPAGEDHFYPGFGEVIFFHIESSG